MTVIRLPHGTKKKKKKKKEPQTQSALRQRESKV